jgi:hypothetical protein
LAIAYPLPLLCVGVYGSLLIARASSGLQVSRGLIWRSTS